MSKSTFGFLGTIGSLLVALCIAAAGAGSGAATQADPTTPPPTTTVSTDGNPWHG
jgi:hypothetical protein